MPSRIIIDTVPPTPAAIARLGGRPLGVREWPTLDGRPALHVCTLPGAELGIDACALAVFMHVSLLDPAWDVVVPVPECVVISLSAEDIARGETAAPPLDPSHVLRPSALSFEAVAEGWESDEQPSFIGPTPVSFENQPMDKRWPSPLPPEWGRFLAQLNGLSIPWTEDEFREVAGIYIFERGAFVDAWG